MQTRLTAWNRLGTDLDMDILESMSNEIGFEDIPEAAVAILKGQVRGRTIVKIPE